MRQRIWRRLCAAAVGLAVVAGPAAAQNSTPPAPVVIQPASPVTPALPSAPSTPRAQPAPGPTAPSVPAAAPVVVTGNGGCTNCTAPGGVASVGGGTGGRGFVMSGGGGYFGTNCQSGHNCNSGCGSLRSDAGFVLGSCRSFFAPCGPGLLGGSGRCHHPVGGTGPAGPFNPCVYDSYNNH